MGDAENLTRAIGLASSPELIQLEAMRLVLLFALAALGVRGASPSLILENKPIPSPAEPGAVALQLASARDGEVWMIWVETSDRSLRVASFSPDALRWSEAGVVTRSPELVSNAYSTPQLAIAASGEMAALWFETSASSAGQAHPSYKGRVSRSPDRGRTWSPPEPLSDASEAHEFASLVALSDGGFLATWLDGRAKHGTSPATALYGRILFSDKAEQEIDSRVCDCCPTGAAAFPDGSALVAYRDRSDNEERDTWVARFNGRTWEEPQRLSPEHWRIEGCPVNGPALASNGAHVSAAWYTAAERRPALYAALSPSAGRPFLAPLQVDDGKPRGHAGCVVLRGGTTFVMWLEAASDQEQFLQLRRISPDLGASVPVRLATLPNDRRMGPPRIALLREDESGGARFVVAYAQSEGEVSVLRSHLLTVDAPLPDRNPCAGCPPDETRGHALHGRVLSVHPDRGQVRVKHDDIPGVMPAMTMRFRVSPDDLAKLKPNQEIFGRIEQKEDGWWLFSVRPKPEP